MEVMEEEEEIRGLALPQCRLGTAALAPQAPPPSFFPSPRLAYHRRWKSFVQLWRLTVGHSEHSGAFPRLAPAWAAHPTSHLP